MCSNILCSVREVEFWIRLDEVLGEQYARVWAENMVLSGLGSRTVNEALAHGVDCKRIWRAVWEQLELPEQVR